ncbi:Chaperone protein DnaJ 1 [Tritrichomonas foetus]|uniref:Chaperone protein DnaJ 1 n=1 Tax=Tritrichomonas foetus TaxID=1144522 RepID=A0A1J4J7J1_9EUKA|nr:Chaperone protein DnaJ 1 [Tritrichomonas foetus]|eukprot:OHS94183.1 Chaperone protein DnaJ 1 [Tritrichomonas foetus]
MALVPRISANFRKNIFGTRFASKLNVNWQAEDFYERLGVKRDATQDEIKKRYHEIIKAYHPDRLPDKKEKEQGEKIMAAVNAAYDVLKDEKSRSQYDQQSSTSPFPFVQHQRPRPVFRESVSLSFSESVFGCKKNIKIDTTIPCKKCNGYGTKDGKQPKVCSVCKGAGIVTSGFFPFPCPSCSGRGFIINDPCMICRGAGEVLSPSMVTVNIPPGVDNGNVLNFSSPQGDVIVMFSVKEDPLMTRDGIDLHVTVPISIKTAILGGYVKVPTLKGIIKKRVSPGTQPNSTEKMTGAGITPEGSLYIHYRLLLPRSLDEKDRESLEKFDDKYMNSTNDMWNSNMKSFQARISPFQKK